MDAIEPVNGVNLFVRRFGDPTSPPLVALHGGPPWDHSYLLPLADALGFSYGGRRRHAQFGNPAEWLAAVREFVTG